MSSPTQPPPASAGTVAGTDWTPHPARVGCRPRPWTVAASHSNLGFADALRRAEERGELRYIGIRHEGAASFAASAYGKLTGRPAACVAIAGPGSTNLLTGLYDAKLDGAPVLAVSGQVPSKVLGRGAFQDVDLSAVFRDVCLSTVTLHAGSNHAELAASTCSRPTARRSCPSTPTSNWSDPSRRPRRDGPTGQGNRSGPAARSSTRRAEPIPTGTTRRSSRVRPRARCAS